MTVLADRAPSASMNAFLVTLHAEHRGPLLRFARRLLPGDPHRAEDVVQECMFRAWRNSETLLAVRDAAVRPWLFTVARNLIVDLARRDNARPVVFGDDDFDLLPGGADFADEVVDRCLVDESLAKLTPMQRQALEQVYRLDCTRQRAAAAVGIPVGTMKSRVHKATIAMSEALAGHGVTAAGC
ncbi:sigma-70 family RNA polymerase sigma factor [Lentzea albidocapillata]|uniref:RNA polymerase sigma-70 factor, ECF subfamily n=1 Tax=Lentzea albidocapillata TaxID=40571 RepID=A0A1W2DGG0_9PSEU|nr:sigma-70 family RNA polymerase sigma factor [Lentzea albidocapillata]SMC96581.1 RNA polymerase sigma-70 factor, ECF subfamily [Lentzea albidocapillata]